MAASVPCRRTIALMTAMLGAVAPLPDTQTPVLVDRWYGAKAGGRAAS